MNTQDKHHYDSCFTAVFQDMRNCIEELDTNAMYELADIIHNAASRGHKLYFTGIGKPSYLAMKNAATCKSMMIDAEYMDACTAGHGDLGPVSVDNESVLLAFSKSGRSKELYGLFKVIKQLRPKCKTVLICMPTDMQLEDIKADSENIDAIIALGCRPEELDGYGCVPSTSNAIFEIVISATLSAALTKNGPKSILQNLQKSHPSGTLYNKVTEILNDWSEDEDDKDFVESEGI